MRYEFPRIEHLDDVRPAIEGRDEFIIAERDWGYVVNYLVVMSDTFPIVKTAGGSAKMRERETRNKAIRRECRGMIFCKKSGRITRRPFFKFFNINERDETQLNNLDFTLSHTVYTKLDGSMISPFETEYGSGLIRFGTKMGITEVAMQAEEFVARNPRYMDFSKWCITNGLTPIFEFTSPENRIVIAYDKPALTLLAVRHMITGEFLQV